MKAGQWQAGAERPAVMLFNVVNMALMAVALMAVGVIRPARAVGADAGADAGANAVVATVGDYKITQSAMDAQVLAGMQRANPNDLYDRRKQALDAMVNSYLIDQAAKKASLAPDAYLKRELEGPGSQVTPADAQKYYDSHKAGITIVEFSDFQCPYCRAAEPTLKQVRDKYGDKIKLVYLDFPLPMHPHALDAANAGRCASDQDKFWQYHDAIFANQGKLDPASLKETAAKAGLNSKKFDACFDSKKMVPAIKADQAQGSSVGVNGTPTFFINGREMVGAESVQSFSEIIDDELAHPKANSAEASAAAAEPQAKAN